MHVDAMAIPQPLNEIGGSGVGPGLASRLVIYNAVADIGNLERYGEVAQRISQAG